VRPAHKSAEPLERNSSGYCRQAQKTSDKLKFASGFHHSRIAENYDKLQFVGHLLSSTLSILWRLRHRMDKVGAIFQRHNPIMTLKNIKRRTAPLNLQLTAHFI
jgi:hypothetical protein